MINNAEFEAYQTYCQLQEKYKLAYKELEQQYQHCKCFSCKLEVILFGLDMLTLNTFVEHMQSQISPEISTILNEMQIDHDVVDGTITVLK